MGTIHNRTKMIQILGALFSDWGFGEGRTGLWCGGRDLNPGPRRGRPLS